MWIKEKDRNRNRKRQGLKRIKVKSFKKWKRGLNKNMEEGRERKENKRG